MGAYMYPITINRNPQKVTYSRTEYLDDMEMSLSELRKYVEEDETFEFFSEDFELKIYGNRLETEEEMNRRVAKEEAYMKGYNEFHAKKL